MNQNNFEIYIHNVNQYRFETHHYDVIYILYYILFFWRYCFKHESLELFSRCNSPLYFVRTIFCNQSIFKELRINKKDGREK